MGALSSSRPLYFLRLCWCGVKHGEIALLLPCASQCHLSIEVLLYVPYRASLISALPPFCRSGLSGQQERVLCIPLHPPVFFWTPNINLPSSSSLKTNKQKQPFPISPSKLMAWVGQEASPSQDLCLELGHPSVHFSATGAKEGYLV